MISAAADARDRAGPRALQRLWRYYHRYGFVSAQLLDEVLSG